MAMGVKEFIGTQEACTPRTEKFIFPNGARLPVRKK
jgi:hypothetical protein